MGVMKTDIKQTGKKIIAVASSTGGPKALQVLIPKLPSNLNAPVLIVQHMPAGFTEALGKRLDSLSELSVKEASEGDILENGHAYLAKGGRHMNVMRQGSRQIIHYTDEPPREGVRPCANFMYESLSESIYDEVICVVLTGMGADGTAGIKMLKEKKKITVIAQNEETCVVYGMPRSVTIAGLSDKEMPLEQIANEIIKNVGVS
ncbi:MAG: chemotaxis protein CheB [Lachnospiraceae bacterium]|nr:chemotaxis protein CheB [Lachnospiraceae bacterium]